LQTHEGLIAELDTCRDLTKKLNEQLAAMTSAVEVAKARKENTLSTREGTLNRLEYLKKRVFEKEQEVSFECSRQQSMNVPKHWIVGEAEGTD